MNLRHALSLAYRAVRTRQVPFYFTQDELRDYRPGEKLPRGFLFGAATSSHQIEGGNDNDWTDWEASTAPDGKPRILHGGRSGVGPDSWNRFDEDLALLEQLGANTYRFSLEWSRIEPEEGRFDAAALERYKGWATQLRARGIEPMVTLLHFTLPKWLAAKGGFESDEAPIAFERYAEQVAKALGGVVDLWCTVNEPTAQSFLGYVNGIWPPGRKEDTQACAEVFTRLLEAHARAARAIRTYDTIDADGDGRATQIGIAHHVRWVQAASPNLADRIVAAFAHDFVNESAIRANQTGVVTITVPGAASIHREIPGLRGSMDYLGLNYYTRDHVRVDRKSPSGMVQFVPEDRPKNDLGWEIYPEGLYAVLKRYGALGLPILITENGLDDRSGEKRSDYLRTHLYAMEKAISEGVDVRGYYHWSLIDNFEWAEGYEPKFGLFRVDLDQPSKRRTPTPAVELFQQVARTLREREAAHLGAPGAAAESAERAWYESGVAPRKGKPSAPQQGPKISAVRVTSDGQGFGLHAKTDGGELELGVSMQEPEGEGRSFGVLLGAPLLGRLVLGLALEGDGKTRIVSANRIDPSGVSAKATFPRDEQVQQKLRALEQKVSDLQQDRKLQKDKLKQRELEHAAAVVELARAKERLTALEAQRAKTAASEGEKKKLAALEAERARLSEAIEAERASLGEALALERVGRAEVEASLRGELERLREDHAAIEVQLEQERVAREALEAELDGQRRAKTDGEREALAAEQQARAEAESALEQERQARAELDAALEQERQGRAELDAALEQERQTRTELDAALEQERQARTELDAALAQEREARAEAEAALEKEREARAAFEAEHSERLGVAESERETREAELQARVDEAYQRLAAADEAAAARAAELERLKEAVAKRTSEIGALKVKLAEEAGRSAAKESAVRDQANALEHRLSLEAERLEATIARNTELTAELEREQARADEAEAEVARTADALTEQRARTSEVEATLAATRSELEEKVAALEAERDQLRTELAEQTSAHAALAEQLSAAEAERERLRDEQRELEQRHAAAVAVRDGNLVELGQEKEALETERARLSSDLDDARGTLAATERRLAEVEAARAALDAELGQTREQLSTTQGWLEQAQAHVQELTVWAEQANQRLDNDGAELLRLSGERDGLSTKVEQLSRELDEEKKVSASRAIALEEEKERRAELLADIEFVRSQVSDLANTKGALLTRLDSMSKREVKRQASTTEMTSMLRDAEVVMADRQTSMRRIQARAEKLEEQCAAQQAELTELRAALEAARADQARLPALLSERDELKVQILFFQKQIAGMLKQPRSGPGPAAVQVAPNVAPLGGPGSRPAFLRRSSRRGLPRLRCSRSRGRRFLRRSGPRGAAVAPARAPVAAAKAPATARVPRWACRSPSRGGPSRGRSGPGAPAGAHRSGRGEAWRGPACGGGRSPGSREGPLEVRAECSRPSGARRTTRPRSRPRVPLKRRGAAD